MCCTSRSRIRACLRAFRCWRCIGMELLFPAGSKYGSLVYLILGVDVRVEKGKNDFAEYIDISPLIPTWVLETALQQEMASSLYYEYNFSTIQRGFHGHGSRSSYYEVQVLRCPGNATVSYLRRSNSISAAIFLFLDLASHSLQPPIHTCGRHGSCALARLHVSDVSIASRVPLQIQIPLHHRMETKYRYMRSIIINIVIIVRD